MTQPTYIGRWHSKQLHETYVFIAFTSQDLYLLTVGESSHSMLKSASMPNRELSFSDTPDPFPELSLNALTPVSARLYWPEGSSPSSSSPLLGRDSGSLNEEGSSDFEGATDSKPTPSKALNQVNQVSHVCSCSQRELYKRLTAFTSTVAVVLSSECKVMLRHVICWGGVSVQNGESASLDDGNVCDSSEIQNVRMCDWFQVTHPTLLNFCNFCDNDVKHVT